MKTKQTILKAFASVALALGAFASADAQQNLGSSCGCTTAVSSRPNVDMTSLPGYVAIDGTFGGELTTGAVLSCANNYTLDKKIYIPAGQTLVIPAGTVIKGASNLSTAPQTATALIIERGGKIDAQGTKSCPIVFTAAADPMNGTYGIENIGKWGGVVILGKATNNLTLAANGPFVPGGAGKLAVADGLGTVEGFASSNPQDQYGVALSLPSNVTNNSPTPPSGTYSFGVGLFGDQTDGSSSNATVGLSGQKKFTLSSSSLAGYVLAGMTVTGTGVPAGATVTGISSKIVTISANLTADAAGTYVFTGNYPAVNVNTPNFYTVSSAPAFVLPATNGYGPFGPTGGLVNFAAPFAGQTVGTFNDNDDSGIMKYVSIRYSGAILAVGAEINGLTLASVGRGTTIENIEIVSCADDNVEIFGGTVNLKYVTTIFGNDDMLDYDLGWTGKCQFFFGMNANATSSPDADSGIEADSDDNRSNLLPRSHPIIRNATFIGRNKTSTSSDNTGVAAITAKELTEGEIYSSIFANYKHGLWLQKSLGARALTNTGGEAWHNWVNDPATPTNATANTGNGSQSLKVKCNTFVGVTSPLTNGNTAITSGSEFTQFTTTDGNVIAASLPGFSYAFTINPATNAVSVKNDVTPFPAVSNSTCPVDADQFWTPTTYRGAFSSVIGENWLSDWSYSQLLGTITTLGAAGSCPTDLNGDGYINVTDFNLFAPTFGNTCN